ncbi:SDR family NAD(P)-dependent oxidoreductase [Bacillus salitolerans]|uniref:SDR family NAD(P)-dependent oxidoreductase n=1 Tax=Bacillus salitolerans TaxID=1437434 RepID=A0ABW4LPM5_9BACI
MVFKDEVVIVTGSTKGIGRSIAIQLAKLGAAVVINARNEEDVKKVVQEIISFGGRATGAAGKVEDIETGRKLVKAAHDCFGRITVVVNNAGIIRDRLFIKMTENEWDDVISCHLRGAFCTTSAVVPYMIEHGIKGTILNMTSTAGLEGTVGQSNYSAAKSGILGLTWTLSKELKKAGIGVFAIAPAALTDMTRPYIEKAEERARVRMEPLPDYWKIGSTEDVAAFIARLLEKREQLESGQIFSVNGKKIGKWNPPTYEEITF